MADAAHLAKLLEGVAAWNQWRKDNPTIIPDLSEVQLLVDAYPSTGLYGRFSCANLQGAFLNDANLQRAKIMDANLQGAHLLRANLQGAVLVGTNLREAYLTRANLQDANISGTNLQGASLWDANLTGAWLQEANLQEAYLVGANLQGAVLWEASLTGANLGRANLQGAKLNRANLQDADVTAVQFDRSSRQRNFRGIRVSACYGSQLFKSFAQDQDYIEDFRGSGWRGWFKFWVWFVLSDCGRSFMLWAAWSLGLATGFGYIYYYWMGPSHFKLDHLTFDLFAMIYYSIVTFTTLGFGDIKPSTPEGAGVVMLEVILGYIMLGGLIAIFANKVARRA